MFTHFKKNVRAICTAIKRQIQRELREPEHESFKDSRPARANIDVPLFI